WTVKPEHFANNTDTPWMQMTDRQRAAWYWKTVNTDLNRGQELLGDRYLRIRFEDLFARDGSGLKSFADWIGLPWKEALLASANKENVNASQAKRCPSWKEWSPEEKHQVLQYCEPLMKLYGYAPERAKRSSKRMRR
ncbi:MAG TPA: hypothetical protein VHP11_17965, partial [Tepidisphaeraceae bacterium]|nr:hypothetical protein [Tepidisphaeraceae bacterium]